VGDKSPILKHIGSIERFEQMMLEGVAQKRICEYDGPLLVKAVRRWVTGTHHIHVGNVSESFALEQHT